MYNGVSQMNTKDVEYQQDVSPCTSWRKQQTIIQLASIILHLNHCTVHHYTIKQYKQGLFKGDQWQASCFPVDMLDLDCKLTSLGGANYQVEQDL